MLKHKVKQLSIIRFIGVFLAIIVALGRWEYKLLQLKKSDDLLTSWLVKLGYLVEKTFLKFLAILIWPLIKFWRGLIGLLALIIKIITWPWHAVVIVWKTISLILTSLGGRAQTIKATVPLKTKEAVDKVRQQARKLKPKPRLFFLKPAAAFATILLIIILPVKFYGHYQSLVDWKDKIIGVSRAALNDAWSGKQSIERKDFSEANKQFSQASSDFVSAEAELSKVNNFLLSLSALLPNPQAKLASESKNILEAARLGSDIAADLTLAMESLFGNSPDKDIVKSLASFNDAGGRAQLKVEQLVVVLNQINEKSLPEAMQADFAYFRERSQFLATSLAELVSMSANLRNFLGETYDKRYLLIFQNNTEARATGGFMGSFAIVDFSKGRVKKMTVPGGGTYDNESGLRKIITPPGPLQFINSRWNFRDANWWPDWPTSAKKIMWFYEQSDGSTVDGVISLTPDVVIKLLQETGPIILDDEAKTEITADNFLEVIQARVEQKPEEQKLNETNAPKAIIGELMDKLITKISLNQDKNVWLKLVGAIEESLNEKQLLLYFNDESLEAKVAELGWDGKTKDTGGDYLSVINTNLGGGKSDKSIKQTIELTTNILSDSSVVDHVKIIRDHQGKASDAFSGVTNYNWLRIYVPLGSKLIEAEGFKGPNKSWYSTLESGSVTDPDLNNENQAEIIEPSGTWVYREGNKTVFANWSMIDPGEIAVIKVSYKLPFKLSSRSLEKNWLDRVSEIVNPTTEAKLYRYSLLVQKQSGSNNSEINYKFEVPSSYEVAWSYPENQSSDYRVQDTDKYWGFVLRDKVISYD
jgi:hypothetical protein